MTVNSSQMDDYYDSYIPWYPLTNTQFEVRAPRQLIPIARHSWISYASAIQPPHVFLVSNNGESQVTARPDASWTRTISIFSPTLCMSTWEWSTIQRVNGALILAAIISRHASSQTPTDSKTAMLSQCYHCRKITQTPQTISHLRCVINLIITCTLAFILCLWRASRTPLVFAICRHQRLTNWPRCINRPMTIGSTPKSVRNFQLQAIIQSLKLCCQVCVWLAWLRHFGLKHAMHDSFRLAEPDGCNVYSMHQ